MKNARKTNDGTARMVVEHDGSIRHVDKEYQTRREFIAAEYA